jgi:2-dehydro-3-deoxygalactonokinase
MECLKNRFYRLIIICLNKGWPHLFEKTMVLDNKTPFVCLDWGTTHRRSYALNQAGACTLEVADDQGALASKGRFAPALTDALHQLQATPERVVMSGMVGSALGWQEVPYVDGNVPLETLSKHLVAVDDAASPVAAYIVPGYCIRNAQGQPDVMRGEETQLLGALTLGHHSGWFVLPGTHSKWVELRNGRITQLRTYMTGELFDLLGKHGTIAAAVGAGATVWDAGAFSEGVRAAGHGALSHQLFGCRARVVCGDMPAASTKSYLSGLLIGTELHDVLRNPQGAIGASTQTFKLIGSPELAAHYQGAATELGLSFEVIDARAAFLGAMSHIQSHWKKP